MVLSPVVFIGAGVGLLLGITALLVWALCVTAAEADREAEAEYGRLRLDEDMLLTWDEICELPETRR
jgi:hypothetical protein